MAGHTATISKVLSTASNPLVGGVSIRPMALRVPPPRDTLWDIQRVCMSATIYNSIPGSAFGATAYVMHTNSHGVGAGFNGFGSLPVAGVWKNLIGKENEIVWVGCVPPSRRAYEPQQPVAIGPADFLILAMYDATDFFTSATNGQGGQYANGSLIDIRFDIDVIEYEAGN